jgi:hypothetical protein
MNFLFKRGIMKDVNERFYYIAIYIIEVDNTFNLIGNIIPSIQRVFS